MSDMSFIDRCLRGVALPDQIDDYVERWHEGQLGKDLELRELLGMSKHEYAIWMRDANSIYSIIEAKRTKRPIGFYSGLFLHASCRSGRKH
jgi:hypothetical protein